MARCTAKLKSDGTRCKLDEVWDKLCATHLQMRVKDDKCTGNNKSKYWKDNS